MHSGVAPITTEQAAQHATHPGGPRTTRPLALAAGSPRDDGQGERPAPPPPPVAPASHGGGEGDAIRRERDALKELAHALERSGIGVRIARRSDLIHGWPWLHVAEAATGNSAGLLLVAGELWLIPGPHAVAPGALGARVVMLGPLTADNRGELARTIVVGLARGSGLF